MGDVDRRQLLAAGAFVGLMAAAGTAPGQASIASAADRLHWRELPGHVRRGMAYHWLWGHRRDSWEYSLPPYSAAALDAVAEDTLRPAFEAGALHGLFFYREAGNRPAATLCDAVLAEYPYLQDQRERLDARLRAVVARAEWDGFFYRAAAHSAAHVFFLS